MGKELSPMLAAGLEESDLAKLRYPLLVSPKFDGIRLRIDPELGAVSRTHKPIPNKHIQEVIKRHDWLRYLDGECIAGEDPTAADVFNKTQSACMTMSGTPYFEYHVFDFWFNGQQRYENRLEVVRQRIETNYVEHPEFAIRLVRQDFVSNPDEVLQLEAAHLEDGFEGIILRSPDGEYKNGRSTIKQQGLLKFKRVQDAEAKVVGFEALERNTNELQRDAFGHAKRSSHKAGKVPDNLLGKIHVEHPTFGLFSIGSGFDVDTRTEIWQNQDKYLGRTVTFKYQAVGLKDKPRFPIFKGFRED